MQIRPRRKLALLASLLFWPCVAGAEPVLVHERTLTLTNPAPWFGGWSGVEVSAGGTRMIAIGDKGTVMQATLTRSDGVLTGFSDVRARPLRGPRGKILRGKRRDAEGLALGPGGQLHVSFEHGHRVMQLDPETGITRKAKPLARGMGLQANSGFEALAVDAAGVVHAIPERSGKWDRPFPLYAHREGKWQIAAEIPRRGPFLPAGADFDALDRLWLLERAATPLGFRTRIRRFDPGPGGWAEMTLLQTLPGRYDNLEALSVWQDDAGQTHLTLLSDDNFLPIQQSQIVEFVLRE